MASARVNKTLQSRNIRHGVYLNRLQVGEANRLRQQVEEIQSEILGIVAKQLKSIKVRGGFHKAAIENSRYQSMLDDIQAIVEDGYKGILSNFKDRLEAVIAHEIEFQVALVKQTAGIALKSPKARDLVAALEKRPIHGRLLDDHFSTLEVASFDAVKQQLNVGMVEGKSLEAIIKSLEEVAFNKALNQVDAVGRTSVKHASAHSSEALWDANGGEIAGVQYVATLDSRTTIICASLDGKVFPPDEGPRPPQHFNCRSVTSVILKGTKPPPRVTFPEWLQDQSPEVQDEVLGKTRARWFREGRVKFDQLVDQSNKPLTIEEIRRHEGLSA